MKPRKPDHEIDAGEHAAASSFASVFDEDAPTAVERRANELMPSGGDPMVHEVAKAIAALELNMQDAPADKRAEAAAAFDSIGRMASEFAQRIRAS